LPMMSEALSSFRGICYNLLITNRRQNVSI
jgi:hypothetical protein